MKIFKKILAILGWICLSGSIGFSIYFAYTQRESARCYEIIVKISDKSPRFMDEAEIAALAEKAAGPIVGNKLSTIDTYEIETKLSLQPTMANVSVYKKAEANGLSVRGKIIIKIIERDPVIRIKNQTEDYYLSMDAKRMPTSPKYVERILIASGAAPNQETESDLIKMAQFVNNNDFWRAQIEQVYIKANGELLLLPQVGDYLIEFGTPDHYAEKFRNLKAVYQQGFKNKGWNKYKIISVKYQNQVVCTKK